ncbi:MAG: class I SAM-dependent methyltransferase [Clostridia bacterium]|nr:class I SAM-dependent methyltransferase [Clostridia bacterium]
MPNSVEDYRALVDKPWGRMFYDMIFCQLSLPADKRMRILDFGAGFCVTADHYAKFHEVIAYEPDEAMYSKRVQTNPYTLLTDRAQLAMVPDGSFDVVLCHNVLEYVPDKTEILQELTRVLKTGGTLSIVKHNLYGRALAYAAFSDAPADALALLQSGGGGESAFGKRGTYDNAFLDAFAEQNALTHGGFFGIRAFFALSTNSEVKYTETWYNDMLALELHTDEIDAFRNIAFFHHLVYQKG